MATRSLFPEIDDGRTGLYDCSYGNAPRIASSPTKKWSGQPLIHPITEANRALFQEMDFRELCQNLCRSYLEENGYNPFR